MITVGNLVRRCERAGLPVDLALLAIEVDGIPRIITTADTFFATNEAGEQLVGFDLGASDDVGDGE